MSVATLDPERCSIVVAGAWNQAIFTPPFVQQHVLGSRKVPEHQAMMGPSGVTFRFVGEKTTVQVQRESVSWIPSGLQIDFAAMETSATRLLTQLRVTPITATGINFGFTVDKVTSKLEAVFNSSDIESLMEFGEVAEVSIRRSLTIDQYIMNLRASLSKDISPGMWIDFNFHRDTVNADDALRGISGVIDGLRKDVADILLKTYDVNVSENGGAG